MHAQSKLSIESTALTDFKDVEDLTLCQAAELLGQFDEFLWSLIGRFYEMGIEDCDDLNIAVGALLSSQLGDCGHHRSFRIQDLVIRLRTRIYEDSEALAKIQGGA